MDKVRPKIVAWSKSCYHHANWIHSVCCLEFGDTILSISHTIVLQLSDRIGTNVSDFGLHLDGYAGSYIRTS